MKDIGERSGFRRHTCHFCRSKKYEAKMRPMTNYFTKACSQFGNDEKCWVCRNCIKEQNLPEKALK